VATTPKPRVVSLEIVPQGPKPFSIGSHTHKALLFAIKVKIGGVAGALASLLGKQPPDTRAWVLTGEAPAFARSDGRFSGDCPVLRMELAIPAVWPAARLRAFSSATFETQNPFGKVPTGQITTRWLFEEAVCLKYANIKFR